MKFDASKFSVDNKFRLICICCAVTHLTFLIEFASLSYFLLAGFNVLSVTLYICCAAACDKGTVSEHADNWINAIYSEIVVHAFLCTLFLGVDVGFYVYYLLTIPIAAYCLFFYGSREKFRKQIVLFTSASVILLIISVVFDNIFGPFYELMNIHTLNVTGTIIMKTVNIFFAMVCLCAFTLMFCAEISGLIRELGKKNEELEYIAEHDSLTGLYNRHALWSYFDDLMQKEESFCVIMGDIDDFKKINDTYGHDCGDVVLKNVAKVFLDEVREGDIAVRWGGEEILMILIGTRNDCLARTEKIRSHINKLGLVYDEENINVSMTFGLVNYTELQINSGAQSSTYMDMLISVADKRLYEGKNSGKNKVVV